MFCVQRTKSLQRMKFTVILVLIFIKFSESHDIECGQFDNTTNSIEFYCTNFNGTLPVNCSASFSVANISDKLRVTELKVRGCDHNKIKQFVEDLPSLQILDFSFSGLESLDLFELKHDRLFMINASHNQLTNISKEFFSQMPKITEIDFSFNELDEFIEMPSNLLKIHLSHNKFTRINDLVNEDVFEKLLNVQYLDLSYNSISSNTFFRIFAENYKLKTLRLEKNHIFEFDYNFFPLVRRTSVILSWGEVLQFRVEDKFEKPIRIVVNEEDKQNSNGYGNEGLFHSTDGKIELRCNSKGFKRAYMFEMFNNHIENPGDIVRCLSPESLKFFQLKGSYIESFNLALLEPFTNLLKLTLISMLTDFDASAIKDHKDLVEVHISHNHLTKIEKAHYFENLNNLYSISIQGNQLENADELVQYLSPNITIFKVDGKILSTLNATSFTRFNGLSLRVY